LRPGWEPVPKQVFQTLPLLSSVIANEPKVASYVLWQLTRTAEPVSFATRLSVARFAASD